MATKPLKMERTFKSSLDGIFTVFSNLKNHKTGQVDKPLKNALYNVGLLILLATFAGVILILLPFIRPLLWGGLFGAVLFPAKKKMADTINAWLQKIEDTETNVVYGLFTIPFNTMDYIGKHIILFIVTHIKIITILSSSLITLRLLVAYLPKNFFSGIWSFLMWQHSLLGKVGTLSLLLIATLLIFYAIIVHIMWDDSTKSTFTICGQFFWVFLIAYICSFFGALQVPVFIGIIVYSIVGYVYHKSSDSQTVAKEESEVKSEDSEKAPLAPSRLMKTKNQLSEIKNKMQLNVAKKAEQSDEKKESELESDFYFKLLFYACTAALVWTHLWIVFLCLIPVSYYAVKSLCKATGLWDYVEYHIEQLMIKINEWLEPRKDAMMPIFLPGVIELNRKLHKLFCEQMKTYVDDISSVFMIVFLIVFLLSLSIFSFFQIYSEAITVAQLSGNLINRTLTHRPDLVEMLPINMQSMNDIIENAYKNSRGTLESHLDSFLNGTDPEQAVKLKSSIISIWDRLVQSYMDKTNGDDTIGPRVTTDSVLDTLDEIVTTSNLTYSGILGWAKSNVAILKDVGNSLWVVLRTNLTLLVSGITTFLGMLIGSGYYMITFLLNTIIFFTTLFYLLQSSQNRYALIAMNMNSAMGRRLADALESSVSSVLVATMKMSLFHGLFCWLTHTVFGAHVVYLPAFLCAIFAAAPFLETYWCSIPAFLDLWLTQDRFYFGLMLFVIHFIVPPNFNSIIHSEIKGTGHPYLTALSIAGGIYLLGLEGAILGPMLLCLLIVLFDFTMNSLNSPTTSPMRSEESAHSLSTATDWEQTKQIADTPTHDASI